MQVIKGAGRDTDRALDLGEAIMQAIEDGMSIAAVVGTLELIKMQITLDTED
jgi:hypothetical protein